MYCEGSGDESDGPQTEDEALRTGLEAAKAEQPVRVVELLQQLKPFARVPAQVRERFGNLNWVRRRNAVLAIATAVRSQAEVRGVAWLALQLHRHASTSPEAQSAAITGLLRDVITFL